MYNSQGFCPLLPCGVLDKPVIPKDTVVTVSGVCPFPLCGHLSRI